MTPFHAPDLCAPVTGFERATESVPLAVLVRDHPRQFTIALLDPLSSVYTVPVGEVHRSAVRWLHG